MGSLEDKLIVGSEEWCGLSSLGIPAIKARDDSGAKTSSLRAFNIVAFKRGGKPWVSFEVHPVQKDRRTVVRCEAPVVDRARSRAVVVRPSDGTLSAQNSRSATIAGRLSLPSPTVTPWGTGCSSAGRQ